MYDELLARLEALEARVAALEPKREPRANPTPTMLVKNWSPGETTRQWIEKRWGSTPYDTPLANFRAWWGDDNKPLKRKTQHNWDLTLMKNPVFVQLMDKEMKRLSEVGNTHYADDRASARALYHDLRGAKDAGVPVYEVHQKDAGALKWLIESGYVRRHADGRIEVIAQ